MIVIHSQIISVLQIRQLESNTWMGTYTQIKSHTKSQGPGYSSDTSDKPFAHLIIMSSLSHGTNVYHVS